MFWPTVLWCISWGNSAADLAELVAPEGGGFGTAEVRGAAPAGGGVQRVQHGFPPNQHAYDTL